MVNKIDESYTSFSSPDQQKQGQADTGGIFGRIWRKFTSSTYPPERNPFSDLEIPEEELLQISPLRGDAVSNDDPTSPSTFTYSRRSGHVPQAEIQRRKRYRDYEDMDLHPEIAAALDMYANDATIENKDGTSIIVESAYEEVKSELKTFFKKIQINLYLWDIVRNTSKYGDTFIENISHPHKPREGIQRIKILDPNFLYREENEYGILKNFYQELPYKGHSYGGTLAPTAKDSRMPLDKNQIVHFRIRNAESQFLPYGKSPLHPAVKIYKQLRLMEDAMFIYRVQRAPERRVFYIDVGQTPASKATAIIEDQKRKLKKEKYFDPVKGKIDERYNPAAVNEDFFIPIRQGSSTKVDTLPGADNLGEIDDVKYFREKILAALKIPKDYFSMGDSGKSDTNKGTLRQLDINYARHICRIQQQVCLGLKTLCKRHLILKGYPKTLINEFEIKLNSPKNAEEREMLELEESKARVLQAYKGLEMLPDSWILERFFGYNNQEIEDLKSKMQTQMEEQAELMGGAEEEQIPDEGAPMEIPQEEEPNPNETMNGEMRKSGAQEVDSDTGAEEAR